MTVANPIPANVYCPNSGGYSIGLSQTRTVRGKTTDWFKVDPYTYSGKSFEYFTFWVKGFGNCQNLTFWYEVHNRTGQIVQKEKRIYQNNSLAVIQQERNPSGGSHTPWDLDDVIYYYGVRNNGEDPAYIELLWIGGTFEPSPGSPTTGEGDETQSGDTSGEATEDVATPSMPTLIPISWTLDDILVQPPPFRNGLWDDDAESMSEPWRRWFTSLVEKLNGKLTAEDILALQAKVTNAAENKSNKTTGGTANNIVILASDGDMADGGKGLPSGDVVGTSDIQTLTNKVFPHFQSMTYVNVGANLTSSAFGRMVKFINGSYDVTCRLPSVGKSDIDYVLGIMRLGTGRLTIRCSDSDTIEKSMAGGGIYCDESGRASANLILYLATETKWAIIGGTGVWKTF